ncbi:MAG TPA: hypothetical protein VGC35_11470 [Allosphingosinicella sp.]|jgi:hypothetical protein
MRFHGHGGPEPSRSIELWPTPSEGLAKISVTLRNPLPMFGTFRNMDDPKTVEKMLMEFPLQSMFPASG